MNSSNSFITEGKKVFNKVPEITIFFWIIKIMATTVGETAADLLNFNLNWGLTNTTYVMCVLLLITLFLQFRTKRYIPAIYWLAVVMISVVGTLITDNLVDNLGVSLVTTTIFFTAALIITFMAWYFSEKTLSVHSIHTIKRESFYWLAILFTFALGTAAGDLASEGLNWGYLNSALIFAALIAVITIAYYRFKLNAVTAFWIAYILTRPLGASIGDYLSQSSDNGGLNLGTVGISTIFLVIILSLVIYLSKTGRDEIKVEQ
ncbi:COG4705 family protein [Paenibacillus segetis]|uniref:Membrane protein n=1 Tax=Paenibacillus segetis TaxID=1325360 RepID=A0ABQ1YBY3_9BACL|nr:hypothetical protein [Paenibacillus segetis]GGH19789.1 membrane protein [Paenibacillus segetis]